MSTSVNASRAGRRVEHSHAVRINGAKMTLPLPDSRCSTECVPDEGDAMSTPAPGRSLGSNTPTRSALRREDDLAVANRRCSMNLS